MWKPLIKLRKAVILKPKFFFHRKKLIRDMEGPTKEEFYVRYEHAKEALLDAERRGERYDIAFAKGVISIMEEIKSYGQTKE